MRILGSGYIITFPGSNRERKKKIWWRWEDTSDEQNKFEISVYHRGDGG